MFEHARNEAAVEFHLLPSVEAVSTGGLIAPVRKREVEPKKAGVGSAEDNIHIPAFARGMWLLELRQIPLINDLKAVEAIAAVGPIKISEIE